MSWWWITVPHNFQASNWASYQSLPETNGCLKGRKSIIYNLKNGWQQYKVCWMCRVLIMPTTGFSICVTHQITRPNRCFSPLALTDLKTGNVIHYLNTTNKIKQDKTTQGIFETPLPQNMFSFSSVILMNLLHNSRVHLMYSYISNCNCPSVCDISWSISQRTDVGLKVSVVEVMATT